MKLDINGVIYKRLDLRAILNLIIEWLVKAPLTKRTALQTSNTMEMQRTSKHGLKKEFKNTKNDPVTEQKSIALIMVSFIFEVIMLI